MKTGPVTKFCHLASGGSGNYASTCILLLKTKSSN